MAGITYRQLDHWATRGWVGPTVQSSTGRGVRRLYAPDDVLHLAALRHFAQSGWPISDLGDHVAATDLVGARWLVAGSQTGVVAVADDEDLHEILDRAEQFTVFDLAPLRARLSGEGTWPNHARTDEPVMLRRKLA